ncbi:myb family transcription factor [Forsythia ovata]|uniref:Myb family transcription factor n=1 Tax=Forsythia ovata TaxID=205694 RepID=A0ABD1TRF0_9LAMI
MVVLRRWKIKRMKKIGTCSEDCKVNAMEKVERKKWKREKKQGKGKGKDYKQDMLTLDSVDTEEENDNKGKKKNDNLVGNCSNDPKPRKSNKKVRFSGHVEVFPPSDDSNSGEGEKLVRGKWFTHEEDEIVSKAVYNYIDEHELGEEGLYMIFNRRKYPEVKNCWKEIGNAIPYRPYTSGYVRASKLFQTAEHRGWTREEYEIVLKYQKEHGNQWKALADELGKHRFHVRNAWVRIKLPNLKKGRWSQEEYQSIFDQVNADLKQRVYEEKRSKHGMLRDNISWTAIRNKLGTRNKPKCCIKWYSQLASAMVAEGIWADADDYRQIGALFNLDACCIEDVDWDNLLDHRSGDACQKRWNQVVLHIGHHGNKSFSEQVEVLTHRYCPYLLEAREAWDSKPRVP